MVISITSGDNGGVIVSRQSTDGNREKHKSDRPREGEPEHTRSQRRQQGHRPESLACEERDRAADGAEDRSGQRPRDYGAQAESKNRGQLRPHGQEPRWLKRWWRGSRDDIRPIARTRA